MTKDELLMVVKGSVEWWSYYSLTHSLSLSLSLFLPTYCDQTYGRCLRVAGKTWKKIWKLGEIYSRMDVLFQSYFIHPYRSIPTHRTCHT